MVSNYYYFLLGKIQGQRVNLPAAHCEAHMVRESMAREKMTAVPFCPWCSSLNKVMLPLVAADVSSNASITTNFQPRFMVPGMKGKYA